MKPKDALLMVAGMAIMAEGMNAQRMQDERYEKPSKSLDSSHKIPLTKKQKSKRNKSVKGRKAKRKNRC